MSPSSNQYVILNWNSNYIEIFKSIVWAIKKEKGDVKKILGKNLIETLDELHYDTYVLNKNRFENNHRSDYEDLKKVLGFNLVP